MATRTLASEEIVCGAGQAVAVKDYEKALT